MAESLSQNTPLVPLADLPRMWAHEAPGTTSINGPLHDVWLEGDRWRSDARAQRGPDPRRHGPRRSVERVDDLERLASTEAWIEEHIDQEKEGPRA